MSESGQGRPYWPWEPSVRTAADELLRGEIGRKTADWGISVKSVEILDVAIPVALQDAMSRQAQAEREKQARVILGSAEAAIAGKFVEAAMTYADHPMALQLRAMNIIYETTKERGATNGPRPPPPNSRAAAPQAAGS
jgi:regulator of protease activity HflC (stomatin/prohibitin superfamily)